MPRSSLATRWYRISGLRVRSDDLVLRAPLDEARAGEAPLEPAITVRFSPGGFAAAPAAWLVERSFDGEARPFLSVARHQGGYLVRVHGHADFVVDALGTEIACAPADGVLPEVVDQLLIDQVLPQVLHLRGCFALHASAVAVSGRAIGLCGPAGSGKSTLAGSLALGGHALLCDDCLALSRGPAVLGLASSGAPVGATDGAAAADDAGVFALSSYACVRLWPDSARALVGEDGAEALGHASPRTSKRRLDLPPSAARLPLARLYLLERRDRGVVLERVGSRDALVAVARHVHRLDPEDRGRLLQELDFLDHLVRRVRVARLAYPRGFDALGAVRDAIARDLEGA